MPRTASCPIPAIDRLRTSEITEVVLTDTVPLPPPKRLPKIKVLSVAPLIGEAIRRIHRGESVGALFSSDLELVQEMLLWDDESENHQRRVIRPPAEPRLAASRRLMSLKLYRPIARRARAEPGRAARHWRSRLRSRRWKPGAAGKPGDRAHQQPLAVSCSGVRLAALTFVIIARWLRANVWTLPAALARPRGVDRTSTPPILFGRAQPHFPFRRLERP